MPGLSGDISGLVEVGKAQSLGRVPGQPTIDPTRKNKAEHCHNRQEGEKILRQPDAHGSVSRDGADAISLARDRVRLEPGVHQKARRTGHVARLGAVKKHAGKRVRSRLLSLARSGRWSDLEMPATGSPRPARRGCRSCWRAAPQSRRCPPILTTTATHTIEAVLQTGYE